MILTKDAFGIKSLTFRKAFKATFRRQSQEIIKNLLREASLERRWEFTSIFLSAGDFAQLVLMLGTSGMIY